MATKKAATRIRDAFDVYMQAYFTERDWDRTMACMEDAATGFGTGADEIGLNPGAFRELYRRDIREIPHPVDFTYHHYQVEVLTRNVGLVEAVVTIRTEIAGQPICLAGVRISTVFRNRKDGWKIVHMHVSLPAVIQQEGESYPIQELEARNRLLEEKVEEKTRELLEQNRKLEGLLAQVRRLTGLLPICCSCKKVRNDKGYWQEISEYIRENSEAVCSHGLCPECQARLYPEIKTPPGGSGSREE